MGAMRRLGNARVKFSFFGKLAGAASLLFAALTVVDLFL